jgi:hypothetical protein
MKSDAGRSLADCSFVGSPAVREPVADKGEQLRDELGRFTGEARD